MQKIYEKTQGNRIVKVFKDNEWDEYRTRLYINKKLMADADYHTDDVLDAIETAKVLLLEN